MIRVEDKHKWCDEIVCALLIISVENDFIRI